MHRSTSRGQIPPRSPRCCGRCWTRCSPSHFDRYFAYELPVGDILDSEIGDVIQAPAPRNTIRLRELLATHAPGVVVRKLAEGTPGISADAAAALARAVAGTLDTTTGDVVSQAGSLIRRLLGIVDAATRSDVARGLLDTASPQLAATVLNWLEAPHDGPEEGTPLLGPADTQHLGRHLTARLLALPMGQLIVQGDQTGLVAYSVCLRYEPQRARGRLVTAIRADAGLLRNLLAL